MDGVTGLPRAPLGQVPAGRLVSAALALGLAMLQGHRPIIVFALHSWGWTDAMIKSALLREKKVGSDGVCGNAIPLIRCRTDHHMELLNGTTVSIVRSAPIFRATIHIFILLC